MVIPLFMSRMVLDPGLIPRYVLLNAYLLLLAGFVIYKVITQTLIQLRITKYEIRIKNNKRKHSPSPSEEGNKGASVLSTLDSQEGNYRIPFQIFNNGIVYCYLGYILFSFISLKYSVNAADGIFDFYKIVIGFVLVVLLSQLAVGSRQLAENYDDFTGEVVKSMSMLNLIISLTGVYQLIQIIINGDITHQSMHAMNGTFIHKNIFAEMLLLTMPFGIYSLLKSKGFWKYAGATGAFISIVLIVFSLTRAAWIAGLVAAFSTVILILIIKFIKTKDSSEEIAETSGEIKPKRNRSLIYWIGGAIIAVAMLVFGEMDKENALGKQIISITNFGYGSTKERIVLWKNTLKIVKDNPLTGDGLGSWKTDILKYGNKGLKSEDNITFYTRPHNDYLWVLAETGIFGFIFFVGIWLFCLGYVVKLVRSQKSEVRSQKTEAGSWQSAVGSWQEDNTIIYVLFFVLVSYLTLSFFSFPRERIEHMVVMGFVISIILIKRLSVSSNQFSVQSSNKKIWVLIISLGLLIIIGIVLIGTMWFGIKRAEGEMHTREAFIERARGNWNGVIENINNVDIKYYEMDPVCTPLNWYKGEAEYKLGRTESAFNSFRKAYEVNPNHIHVLNNLGTCYELKNEHQKAIFYYEKAIHLSPHFEDALLNIAAVNFNIGNYKKALSAIREIDVKTQNKKYNLFLMAILKKRISEENDTISNGKLKKAFIDISRTDAWMLDIFMKSKKNNISFEKQLFLDAIYSLEKIDKEITFAESELLKKRYVISRK